MILGKNRKDINAFHKRCQIQVSSSSKQTKSRGRKQFFNENLAVSLDVTKLIDLKAAMVLTHVVKHLGSDPSEYNINVFLRRGRITYRAKMSFFKK